MYIWVDGKVHKISYVVRMTFSVVLMKEFYGSQIALY